MAKYSYELKKKTVVEYLNGQGGYRYLAKKYNIDSNLIRMWIAAYKELGNEGLKRRKKNKNYSFDFKLHVVELYLTTNIS